MARYYFHTQDGMAFPDNHGKELDSLQQARSAAIDYACDMVRLASEAPWKGQESVLRVTNWRGAILFTLAFCATDTVLTA